jgi:hypothetical protein
MVLGKLLNLPKPWFLVCKVEKVIELSLKGYENENIYIKHSVKLLAHGSL